MAIEYISNKELLAKLIVYRTAYYQAKESGSELPQISNEIAQAIMRIANKLSTQYNFVNYTYREEMIGDAIVKCLAKMHLFDPSRQENPFAYITQICWNEFILRISKEQNESSVKAKMIREKMSSEYIAHGEDADSDEGSNQFVEFLKSNDAYVDYNEEKLKRKNQAQPEVFKHRNKTAYKKVEPVEAELPFDLSQFEGESL